MLMKGGGKNMKLLKADSDLGYFLTNDGKYRPIDEIKKEDLLRLVCSEIVLAEKPHLSIFSQTRLASCRQSIRLVVLSSYIE